MAIHDYFLCYPYLHDSHGEVTPTLPHADIHGTYNRSQLTRFLTYARSQLPYVEGRILHLEAEVERTGQLLMALDASGNPLGYSSTPPGSVVDRLFKSYLAQGGSPLFDLQLRAMSQPVYLQKGDETTAPQLFNNGEVLGRGYNLDATTGELMFGVRTWLDDALGSRLGWLERQIRRHQDYRDQLSAEVALLRLITSPADTGGSLANLANELTTLLSDPLYRAVYDDLGKDPFGRLTAAPFAAYDTTGEAGETRAPQEEYVKTSKGVVVPGQRSV